MENQICVSSYSVRQLLGPIQVDYRGQDGNVISTSWGEPVYSPIARILPYAAIVHAKTQEYDENGRPMVLDVVRALRIVRESGFTGPISLEYKGTSGDPCAKTARTMALVEEAFAE